MIALKEAECCALADTDCRPLLLRRRASRPQLKRDPLGRSEPQLRILQNHYVLAVHNVRESAKFYTEKLGFELTADHVGWIFVARDNCMIMLGECPDDMHPSQLGCHNYFAYLRVDDINAYHRELQERGVESIAPIADEPWGMREFSIRTPDGHRIKIGQQI